MFFGFGVEFFFAQDGKDFHLLHDLADVLDGVDYVAGTGLPFGADHGRAFGDAAQGFAQIARSADEGDFEGMLVDMVSFVSRGQDFGLVNVVDPEFLKNLSLSKMPNAALGHDRDRDLGHDLANLLRRSHASNAAFGADLRGDALQRHYGYGASFFGDGGLLGVGDVHDDAAFQHFGQAGFQAETGGAIILRAAVVLRHGGLFSGCGLRLSGFGEALFILQRVRDSRYPRLSAISHQQEAGLRPVDSRGRLSPHELMGLSFYVLGEHFCGVDGYEGSAAAGQDFILFV